MPGRVLFSRAVVLSVLCVISMGQGQCGAPPTQVHINTPANGTFLDQASVMVEGSTTRYTDKLIVTVNGVTANLSPLPGGGGFWTATVPLDAGAVLNPIEAVVTANPHGFFIDNDRVMAVVGDSIPDGQASPEAAALRINDSGLDQMEGVVGDLVDLDLATLLPVGTVLIDDCFIDSFLGCLGSAVVRVANPPPGIDTFGISLDSQTNEVDAVVDITGLEINVDIDGSGLVPNCGLRITATGASIAGGYGLQPDALEPTAIDVVQNGNVAVGFVGFNDEFTSGICDAPIIGDIVQAFLPDIQNLANDGVAAFLNTPDGNGNTPVAGAVEDALAGLEITGPIGSGLGVMLETPIFDVFEDVDGITLDSDMLVTAEDGIGEGQCVIPAGAPDLPASYHVSEAFPAFGPTTPGGTPYDLGLCVSSSGFNQLLKAQTECGLLRADLTELAPGQPITAGLLALPIQAFQILAPSTPITIRLAPTVAPVVTGNPGPAGELAEILIGQLLVDFVRDVGGQEMIDLRLAADAKLGFDLSFDAGSGALIAALGEPAVQDITLVIIGNRINASQNQVQNFLPQIFAPLLPDLGSALGAIPIPSLLGLELSFVEVSKNGQFMSVFFDVSTTP